MAPGHHDIQNERTCCTSRNIGLWYVLYIDKDSQPHECGKLKMFTMIRNDLARSIPDSEKKQRKRKKSGNYNVISTLTSSVVNVDDVEERILYDLEKEFDEMLLDQGNKEERGGHNNGQMFLMEKLFNLTELKKSKSDNVMVVEEWKTDDDPPEYNFLFSDILNL